MMAFTLAVFVLAILQQTILSLGSTAPAFVWSPYIDRTSQIAVNYQTLSTEDLAKSVLSQGGWSDLLCAGKSSNQPLDAALVFIGKELRSSDVVGNKDKASLIDFLKNSFTRSNFSMAFPYVAVTEDKGTMESSLLAEFKDTCERGFGANIILMGSCSMDNEKHEDVAELGLLVSKMEKGRKNLVVYCNEVFYPSGRLEQHHSESSVLSNVIGTLEGSGLKYAALYVSDAYNPIQYPSSHQIKRFIAESSGNSSANTSTVCDGVCQIKTSLLEAVFVAIVLLVILISGLCCMMGIDTPTRFEAPQEP